MRKAAFAFLALAALMIAAPARADEWTKKYTFTGKPEIHLDSHQGRIDVQSSDRKDVEVFVRTTNWRIPQDVEVIESQSGNHLELEIHIPRWSFHLSSHHGLEVELHVPQQADLDLHSGNGDITTQPVTGTIRLATGNGNINAHGIEGNARLSSGNGRIEGSGFKGSLEASSGNGQVHVSGSFEVLRLKSGNGSIEAEVASGSKMSSSWSLHTGNGGITLRLPDGFSADLNAHTGSGRIETDFPITVLGSLSHSTVQGHLGGGGPELELRSGNGSIHLERM